MTDTVREPVRMLNFTLRRMAAIPSREQIKKGCGKDYVEYEKEVKNSSGWIIKTIKYEDALYTLFKGFAYLKRDGCQFSIDKNNLIATKGTFTAKLDLSRYNEYVRKTLMFIIGLEEDPAKKKMPKTIDLTRYIEKKHTSFYGGILHENGIKIATNGHILCAIKSDYPPEYEGQVINHQGEDLGNSFPKWKEILRDETTLMCIEKDWQSIKLETKLLQLKVKREKKKVVILFSYSDGVETGILHEHYLELLEFFKFYPDSKVYIDRDNITKLYITSGLDALFVICCVPNIAKIRESVHEFEIYEKSF